MRPGARILISGAGIAGLVSALWLARHGLRPVVVERADSIRAGGFLVSLSHHGYRFAERLDLLPALRRRDAGIVSSSYHDADGRVLLRLDYRRLFRGVEIIQLMRDDLAQVLYDAAREVAEIRFADEIVELGQTPDRVEVRFAGGGEESFEAVVGADGGPSAVRRLAFEDGEVIRHDLDLFCAAYRLTNVLGLEAKFETHMERQRYMAVFTTRDDDLGSVFVWRRAGGEVPPGRDRPALLRQAFDAAPAAVARALDQCPDDRSIYMDRLQQIEMARWHKGRVALVGDAAHCLTLFSGRGAAAAFAGASRLALALVELEPEEAFRRYEAETRPVIERLQPATREAVRWYVPGTGFNQFMRNNAMRWLPNGVFREYFRYKYSQV